MADAMVEQLMAARVRVPASTSNLGAGFDCLGLALRRYLEATFEPGGAGLALERRGTLATLAVSADHDLLARAFRAELRRLGAPEPRGRLTVDSEIPISRGLGSSGAALVAGAALASMAAGERRMDVAGVLHRASAEEGHPDNVAAALHGGLVAIARDADGGMHTYRLAVSEHLGFAFAAPGFEVATPAARAVLPATVPHEVAVRATGRMAALLRGLATGEPEALRVGFQDELHVPYRLPLIAGARAVLDAALGAGAWAATISGSGSGLIAVCSPRLADDVAAAMAAAFRAGTGDADVTAFAAAPDFRGVTRETP